MKYKAVRRKKEVTGSRSQFLPVGAGLLLVCLPFVVSFAGFDTFRLPKNIFASVAVAVLAFGVAVAGRTQLRVRWFSWEALLLVGLGYTGIHTLVSSSPGMSWNAFLHLSLFALLFMILKKISTGEFQQCVWLWIGAATGVNGVLTILQYYGKFQLMQDATGNIISGRLNPAGLIGEVNSGGFLFGLVSILMLYFVVASRKMSIRITASIILGLNLAGLAFARTLTAVGGLVACSLIWLLFHHWWLFRNSKTSKRNLTVLWLFLLIAGLGVLGVAYQGGTVERIDRVWEAVKQSRWEGATAGRIPVYQLTWAMIDESPWLGRGLNTFGKDFFYYRADTELGQSVRMFSQPGAFREVHNEYLQVWLELGIIGFTVFLLLLFIPLYRSIQMLKVEREPKEGYWIGVLTIGLIFIAVSCVAFFPLHLSVTGTYVVLVYAGLRRIQDPGIPGSPFLEGRREWILPRKFATVVWALVLAAAAFLAIQHFRSWAANNEIGVAAFLIVQARSDAHTAIEKRAFADDALTRLEKAEALSSRFHEVYNLKGSALMGLGRYEMAVESYQRAVEYIPSPELYTNLAAAYLALDARDKAKDCLDLALRYDSRYGKARQALRFLQEQAAK